LKEENVGQSGATFVREHKDLMEDEQFMNNTGCVLKKEQNNTSYT
jgi:hypothetical protein